MSVNKWAYNPKMCDREICPGDCDECAVWKNYNEHEEDEDNEND